MRVGFVWKGLDGRYGMWKDGLYAAIKLISKEHEVRYFDTTRLDEIHDFKPDVVLFWEAPCSLKGKDAEDYLKVLHLPYKKALLFAGGPVEAHTCYGFDLYFVESKVNEEEFERLGLPWKRAFGVNTQIMRPFKLEKRWEGIIQATFAGWKRHELFADAMGERGCAVGRVQEFDKNGYDRCITKGVNVFPEMDAETVALMINQSNCVVNTAEYWGGGQRCTLEAMACGVPVIVMKDSPKNCEYVEESGAGIIVEPTKEAIQDVFNTKAYEGLASGYRYVHSKWTEHHYAQALLDGIAQIVV